uniref:Transmembrane protein n=1 Tax=Panagrellus redivivus TaxID=6233 RepID=A0A7E4UYV2_PANRE
MQRRWSRAHWPMYTAIKKGLQDADGGVSEAYVCTWTMVGCVNKCALSMSSGVAKFHEMAFAAMTLMTVMINDALNVCTED